MNCCTATFARPMQACACECLRMRMWKCVGIYHQRQPPAARKVISAVGTSAWWTESEPRNGCHLGYLGSTKIYGKIWEDIGRVEEFSLSLSLPIPVGRFRPSSSGRVDVSIFWGRHLVFPRMNTHTHTLLHLWPFPPKCHLPCKINVSKHICIYMRTTGYHATEQLCPVSVLVLHRLLFLLLLLP